MRREKPKSVKSDMKKRREKQTSWNIQKIIGNYFENLYSNKFENIEEMDRFLDTNNHPKLNQEDINYLNRSIT
jgi:hypothetical protein